MRDTDYHRPASAGEAVALAAATGGAFLAGGTALQLGWTRGHAAGALIDLAGIDFGPKVAASADGLRLSAAATLERLRGDAVLAAALPALPALVGRMAGLGVRTMATLGGNLAWRAGDLVPPLLALGAEVETPDGRLPLAAWLAGAPTLILAVHVRPAPLAVEKVGRREAFSPTVVTVARSGGRIAVGGGAVPPQVGDHVAAFDLPGDAVATSAHRQAVVANLAGFLAA